jgi:hypothetical protein
MSAPLVGAGEGADPGVEDTGAGEHRFRDGSSMTIDKAALGAIAQKIFHGPEVVAALTDKVNQMCDYANSLAVQKGAEYAVTIVDDWPDSRRARANVWSSNFAAMLDDAHNATLLKTLAHFGGSAAQ